MSMIKSNMEIYRQENRTCVANNDILEEIVVRHVLDCWFQNKDRYCGRKVRSYDNFSSSNSNQGSPRALTGKRKGVERSRRSPSLRRTPYFTNMGLGVLYSFKGIFRIRSSYFRSELTMCISNLKEVERGV